MKIYAVSDLHGNLDGLDPCDADLVVIAGDLAPMKGWGVWHVNDQMKWINRKFSTWCEKYPKIGMSMFHSRRNPRISAAVRWPRRSPA